MIYKQVYLGGHAYEVFYYPQNDRIQGFTCRSITDLPFDDFIEHVYHVEWLLAGILDKPVWFYRDNNDLPAESAAQRSKTVRFYADERYIVSILAQAYENSADKLLVLNFWAKDAPKAMHEHNIGLALESMRRQWNDPATVNNNEPVKLPWPKIAN